MNWLIRKLGLFSNFILISLFFPLIVSCNRSPSNDAISIVWKDRRAVALAIPNSLIIDHPGQLKVRLMHGQVKTDILGQIRNERDTTFFDPVVPFTRGLHYKLLADTTTLATIDVPPGDSTPELLSIYPTQDTVPENLLKIYLRFSQPMEEGRSLSHLTILRNNDTLKDTFLDLQPELWNNDGTMLTLWLDPGRIKRDLIPNKKMGTPLNAGAAYTLFIEPNWRSKDGGVTNGTVTKKFVAILRDELSPRWNSWTVSSPASSTKEELVINFYESLDFSLASEAIDVIDPEGRRVEGTIAITDEERKWSLIPEDLWTKGKYIVKIGSRLEDLAGNNLNRPFDRDLTKKTENDEKVFIEKSFVIP